MRAPVVRALAESHKYSWSETTCPERTKTSENRPYC